MSLRSFIVSLVVGLPLLAAIWGGVSFWQNYSEYRQFKKDEMEAASRLERIEQQLKEQEKKFERLNKDQPLKKEPPYVDSSGWASNTF